MKKPKIARNKLFLAILILWGVSWLTQTTISINDDINNEILLTNPWFVINLIIGFILVAIAFIRGLKEKCYVYAIIQLTGIVLLAITTYVASHLHM